MLYYAIIPALFYNAAGWVLETVSDWTNFQIFAIWGFV